MRSNLFSPDFRVLILAPTFKDAKVTVEVLARQSIQSFVCTNIAQICEEILRGADAAIITEEAILGDKEYKLENVLKNQPPWSDFPLIVLVPAGQTSFSAMQTLQATGNMTMVARPVQIAELVSTVQAALRDRKRQYRLRDYLIETKKNAEILKEAQHRLQTALQAGRMGTWELELPTRALTCSAVCKANYGRAADEPLSLEDIADCLYAEDAARWHEVVNEIIETPADFELEYRVVWPDGSIHWIYVRGACSQESKDNATVLSGVSVDISDRKNAEIAALKAKADAEAANLAKTEFLANMSHEIRTPMNAVIGLSNILAMTKPLTEKQKEMIGTLRMSADSLLALINDLLDIAKIEAQTVELEEVSFSMTQLIEEVVSMTSMRANEKNLQFSADSECVQGHRFIGDPTRIRQIILNLCSNALKFTEQGSVHISITSQPDSQSEREIISIAVEDTGIGIAPDKLPMIFDKFVQADSSINRKYGGTGLGLAITKTLAEVMGGNLEVESKQGKGSIFTVRLPLKVDSNSDASEKVMNFPEVARHRPDQVRPTVLLVEDYAANVLVARIYLEEFGYNCEVASNGIEAIEKIKEGNFVAVLMDVQMHGMNGLDTTRVIRENERQKNLAHLPIIGMTAHALAGDCERCLAAGMDDYIAKPFDPKQLEAILADLVNARKKLYSGVAN